MAKTVCIIPARFGSVRFPGKPLVEIAGKPMIQHVWERACSLAEIAQVIIATDDPRIEAVCKAFGADVAMTSPHHPSGTDRIWEVAQALPEADWLLNLQGDEPFMNPLIIRRLLNARTIYDQADILTAVTPIASMAHPDWQDPNCVKAVLSHRGQALYFSRASIPFIRDKNELTEGHNVMAEALPLYRHLGLYLYKRGALAQWTTLPPSPLEKLEKLEQLRALEAGLKIFAIVVAEAPIGIDTPADLQALNLSTTEANSFLQTQDAVITHSHL